MSVNTAHTSNGVLLQAGEFILLHCNSISMLFSGQQSNIFRGCKCGKAYLTSHRIIFNTDKAGDDMQSWSAPYVALSELKLEKSFLGNNFISGKLEAQPNGNFTGKVMFKMFFRASGALEFESVLQMAVRIADLYNRNQELKEYELPPYRPAKDWYEASTASYKCPEVHAKWLPKHPAFSEPAPNTVFVTDNEPPFLGLDETPIEVLQKSPEGFGKACGLV